ncbi:MipA/OmpV family protein [Glaciimonas sp. GG7]
MSNHYIRNKCSSYRLSQPKRKSVFLLSCVASLCGALSFVSVNAQAAEASSGTAAKGNAFVVSVGGGLVTRYSGSDQRQFFGGLSLDYAMQNGFYASTSRGIGYGNTIGAFHYSTALGYRSGRAEKNANAYSKNGSTKLRGMGDISGSVTTLLTAGYMVDNWLDLTVIAEIPLSQRQNGSSYHFNARGKVFSDSSNSVTLGVTASVADSKYAQTYYGVTAQQSAASGYAAYKPKAGLYESRADLTWTHQFNPRWSVDTTVGVVSLTRDVGKSPIVVRKTSPVAGVTVNYTF